MKFKIEMIENIFFDHNGMKLEIKNRRKPVPHKYVEIKQHTQATSGSIANKKILS